MINLKKEKRNDLYLIIIKFNKQKKYILFLSSFNWKNSHILHNEEEEEKY